MEDRFAVLSETLFLALLDKWMSLERRGMDDQMIIAQMSFNRLRGIDVV